MLGPDSFRMLHTVESVKTMKDRPSVAVIGAGISGMACARLLTAHGYPVTVFEKEKEAGGRSSIHQNGPYVYDHGCQYFLARDKRFVRHVEMFVEKGAVSTWPVRLASCLHGVVHQVEEDADLYVGVPGMNAIATYLSPGVDLRRDTIVSTVKRVNQSWKLIAGGKRETFDVVVVSAPAEQTAQLLHGFPVIADEAANVKTRPCLSVTVGFEHMLNASFDAAHFSSCPIMWASNNRTKPGRPHNELWTIQATTKWSGEHFSSPDDMIAKIVLSSFFESSGIAPVVPTFTRTHKWFYGWSEEPLKKDHLWDKDTWLGACGDWCHNGRVEGAFLSGISMAENIIKDCPQLAHADK
jgi:predicted NAD/FAD-dependent oxidoreductase